MKNELTVEWLAHDLFTNRLSFKQGNKRLLFALLSNDFHQLCGKCESAKMALNRRKAATCEDCGSELAGNKHNDLSVKNIMNILTIEIDVFTEILISKTLEEQLLWFKDHMVEDIYSMREKFIHFNNDLALCFD